MAAPLALTRLRAEDAAPRILQPQRLAQLIEAAREEGHARGRAEALGAEEARHRQVLAALAESLSDAALTQAECRRAVLDSLRPLVAAMVETLLPGLAADGFSALVARQVCDLAAEAPVRLRCHPEAAPSLREALEAADDAPGVTLVADPGLERFAAILEAGAHLRRVDMEAALSRIRALSADFFLELEKECEHDRGIAAAGRQPVQPGAA